MNGWDLSCSPELNTIKSDHAIQIVRGKYIEVFEPSLEYLPSKFLLSKYYL